MKIYLFWCVFLIVVLVTSCKKYQSAPEAFFLKPGKIQVAPKANQGSNHHKITDLWVYTDGFFKGVYPIDNVIPVVSNGKKVRVNVFAGIKNNGISDTRLSWLFYDQIEFDTLVEAGKTIERDFTFNYNNTCTFKWLENFDNQGQSLIKSSNSAASTVSLQLISGSESIDGKFLELTIKSGGNYAQIETYNSYELPLGNSNVYLELNYKCNNPFAIGLIGDNTQVKDVFTFNVQNNWNKAYIQLASIVNSTPVSNSYKICFYMAKTQAEEPRLLLDNLKLVYL